MSLFLVTGEIEESHYMDSSRKRKVIRLVDAESEDDAERKFINYYEAKSREYDVHYTAHNVEATCTIS